MRISIRDPCSESTCLQSMFQLHVHSKKNTNNRRYERELKRLRDELHSKSQSVVSKRRLLEMDQQRRQAEQDKMAAIRALEARSVEMMREKAEKRKLERRIAMLRSQMLGNFDNIKKLEEIPEFRNVQQKIHHQYVVFEREAQEYC